RHPIHSVVAAVARRDFVSRYRDASRKHRPVPRWFRAGVRGGERPLFASLDSPGNPLEPAPLKASDGGQNAAFSPDGRRIAFNGAGTMVVNVDGTGLVAVGDTTGILLPFAWADEDHLIVASKNGLSRMAVQGGGLEVV